jgi:selenide,water dikinase
MIHIDVVKRRRVMQRSQQLGHCICDPRKPCPCDSFRDEGLCPCAGERPQKVDPARVRLTELVRNAGCASKISPGDLEAVLARLPAVNDPAVVSGIACGDDAGVYRLADGTHLVQTVDVMTPCCDDPHTFGRICAANCLSDIYAMGGVPKTALSILAFPSETMSGEIMYQMLRGAMEVLAEAGVALIGGHSVKDDEIKLGFAVTGTIEPARLTAHDTARVGDLMVLTKPLGVGVLSFARQIGRGYGDFELVVESMAALNRPAADAAARADVSACTDVTGFGLFGHMISLARHSGVTAEVWTDALPPFPGALEAIREGVIPGAVERNMEYVGEDLVRHPEVDEARVVLGFDSQTSGGLLICVSPDSLEALLKELEQRDADGWVIGKITEKSNGRIVVANKPDKDVEKDPPCCEGAHEGAQEGAPGGASVGAMPKSARACPPAEIDKATSTPACCEGASDHARADLGMAPAGMAPTGMAPTGVVPADAFAAFMKSTAAAGAVDAQSKELITFALVVLSRCGPCLKFHRKKALEMGLTREQLDEAAWLAVAMGGAPVRMFYLEHP